MFKNKLMILMQRQILQIKALHTIHSYRNISVFRALTKTTPFLLLISTMCTVYALCFLINGMLIRDYFKLVTIQIADR